MIIEVDASMSDAWESDLVCLSDDVRKLNPSSETMRMAADTAKKHLGCLKLAAKEIRQGKGYILLRGCPVGELLDVGIPSDGMRPFNKDWVSELALVGSTLLCGYSPFGYKQERRGRLVHEIAPIKNCGTSISSIGNIEFKPHADGAYLPREHRPETLSLICLNNEAETSTSLTVIDDIVSELTWEYINILSSADFVHISPETFNVGSRIAKSKSSIIDLVDGRWEVKVATHNTLGQSVKARMALELFSEIAEAKSEKIDWKPGDILIFNNFRCLHSRKDIQGNRWLQRCYGSRILPLGAIIDLVEQESSELELLVVV